MVVRIKAKQAVPTVNPMSCVWLRCVGVHVPHTTGQNNNINNRTEYFLKSICSERGAFIFGINERLPVVRITFNVVAFMFRLHSRLKVEHKPARTDQISIGEMLKKTASLFRGLFKFPCFLGYFCSPLSTVEFLHTLLPLYGTDRSWRLRRAQEIGSPYGPSYSGGPLIFNTAGKFLSVRLSFNAAASRGNLSKIFAEPDQIFSVNL